jgi:hypothetical protein
MKHCDDRSDDTTLNSGNKRSIPRLVAWSQGGRKLNPCERLPVLQCGLTHHALRTITQERPIAAADDNSSRGAVDQALECSLPGCFSRGRVVYRPQSVTLASAGARIATDGPWKSLPRSGLQVAGRIAQGSPAETDGIIRAVSSIGRAADS